jgi:hypothetical protein
MSIQRRPLTTVVALVGEVTELLRIALRAADNARLLDASPNTTAKGDHRSRTIDPLSLAARAWEQSWSSSRNFTVHEADPLLTVADAWVSFFDSTAAHGTIEVARSLTLARFQAGTMDLPDCYIVVNAEALSPTRREWYLGVLHDAAPTRVIPCGPEPHQLLDALATWQSGRWWPSPDALLANIERRIPLTPTAVREP